MWLQKKAKRITECMSRLKGNVNIIVAYGDKVRKLIDLNSFVPVQIYTKPGEKHTFTHFKTH